MESDCILFEALPELADTPVDQLDALDPLIEANALVAGVFVLGITEAVVVGAP